MRGPAVSKIITAQDRIGLSPDDVKQELIGVLEQETREDVTAYMNFLELNPELNGFPVLEIAFNPDLEEDTISTTLYIASSVQIDVTFNDDL